jgi:hypothetical protein
MKLSTTMTTFILLFFILLSGCATGSGSLFERTVEADADEEGDASGTEPVDGEGSHAGTYEEDAEKTTLIISTEPSGAEVFINHTFAGYSTFETDEIDAGQYRIDVKKERYYRETRWIVLEKATKLQIDINLEPITGLLEVQTDPPNAKVLIGTEELDTGVSEVQIGRYTLTIRRFGYEDYTKVIDIRENSLTEVTAVLEEAAFRLSSVTTQRQILNPANPGILGKTEITFFVSTYGTGRVYAMDSSGTEVWSSQPISFSSWKQSVVWDGRSNDGAVLPDGNYRIVAEGQGEEDGINDSESTRVQIDSSALLRNRSVWSGTAGLLYSPGSEVIAPGSIQLSFAAMGHAGTLSDGTAAFRIPAQLSLRSSPAERLELDVQASVILLNSRDTDFTFWARNARLSVSLLYQMLQTRPGISFGIGLNPKFAFLASSSTDTQTNFPGFHLGIPFQLKLGFFNLLFDPELVVSTFAPYSSTGASDTGIVFFSYFRSGILLDFADLQAGISCALRTNPFYTGFSLSLPVSAGIELHYLLPDTLLSLSLYGGLEFNSIHDYYGLIGGGVSILN